MTCALTTPPSHPCLEKQAQQPYLSQVCEGSWVADLLCLTPYKALI